jgi:hypothetical protein
VVVGTNIDLADESTNLVAGTTAGVLVVVGANTDLANKSAVVVAGRTAGAGEVRASGCLTNVDGAAVVVDTENGIDAGKDASGVAPMAPMSGGALVLGVDDMGGAVDGVDVQENGVAPEAIDLAGVDSSAANECCAGGPTGVCLGRVVGNVVLGGCSLTG